MSTRSVRRLHKLAAGAAMLSMLGAQTAIAASSWNPTLLVNTESFNTIDEGDGTTNIEMRFGQSIQERITYDRTNRRFEFSRGIRVNGDIVGTGSLSVRGLLSGQTLYTRGAATVGGALSVTGAITTQSNVTAQGNVTARGTLSGAALTVNGPGNVRGLFTASGNVITDGDMVINDDAGAVDGTLTFGNASGNQTLKYLNSSQRFQLSRGLSVVGNLSGSSLNVDRNATVGGSLTASGTIRTKGNLSGSTLTVDGNLTLRGQTYVAPTAQGDGFLKNDGAGNLTWTAASVGNGSGGILSMHPEYPNAVYFSSGSSYIGQMTASGGTAGLENSYVWTSTKATLQSYWISVRVRVPDNFSSWDAVKPIEFRYKTGVAASANNHVTVRIKDTTGAFVTLTNGDGLANTSWTTANITGPQSAGTWTPKGYFTVYVKVAANSTAGANAAASFINFNFETTTP